MGIKKKIQSKTKPNPHFTAQVLITHVHNFRFT